MKAIQFHEFGSPEVLLLEEIPQPTPAPGEILVQVKAAAINPADAGLRAGRFKDMIPTTFPVIPGFDVAGVVVGRGEGVTQFAVGDEVIAMVGWRGGAYAEHIAFSAADATLKPASLDFVEASAIPLGALTSYQAIYGVAGLQPGQTLLVHAASGGVGSIAVQLAKAKGARVIGTASGKNEEFVRGLGVDQFIDYTTTRFEDVVKDVDVVFDTMGGDTQERSYGVLKPGGFLVAASQPPKPESAAAHGVRAGMVNAVPNGAQLKEVADLVESGKIKAYVETVLTLEEAAKAHELIETHHTRGKIVLKISD